MSPVYKVGFSQSYLSLTRLCSVKCIVSLTKEFRETSLWSNHISSIKQDLTCLRSLSNMFVFWTSVSLVSTMLMLIGLSVLYSRWVLHWSGELIVLALMVLKWALHIEWLALCISCLSLMSVHSWFTRSFEYHWQGDLINFVVVVWKS